MNDDQPQRDSDATPETGGEFVGRSAPAGPAADPLDETQPVDVPRYAPAPDPRPDARWAWASPGQGSPDRWYDPGSSGRPGVTPPPPAYTAAPVPVQAPVRGRGGAGLGTVVAATLLSAVVASGGTVLILDRAGALDRTIVQTGPAQGTSTGSQLPVTIDESSAVIDVAAKVSPAVVKIEVAGAGTDPFSGVPSEGVGSGVIYDSEGWILTNRHVVSGADTLTVELKDGRKFPGTVYGIDTLTDLAIVKVDQSGLPAAVIGQSDGLKIGQLVVAIGSPLGTYSFSVTSGIVSGKGRNIQVDDGTRINNLIQTDAAINPGNSGGPLADASGAVVGINTAVATQSAGIGFAIPIDIARPIMEQALAGKELARPWIGIRFESIDLQLKQDKSLPVDAGALVTTNSSESAIVDGSPAAEAGLREGDIIRSLNGKAIDAEHPLDALLVQFSPGDTIQLDVLRDGASIQLDVTLGTRPNNL